MKTKDYLWLGLLAVLAVGIWQRNTSWRGEISDVVPLLAALPLFVWLGAPWRFSEAGFRLSQPALALGVGLFLAGTILNLTVLLAGAWTAALWSWLRMRLAPETLTPMRSLLVFPLLAFPWLNLDVPDLGWFFRLSAGWTAEHLFQALGLAVQREGTMLFVQHQPFDVSPACSGLRTLQAMLVAGAVLCYLELGQKRVFWLGVACLPLVAWMANTLRVLALMVAALSLGVDFASGWFHDWGGWLVIFAMFGLTWGGFQVGRRIMASRTST